MNSIIRGGSPCVAIFIHEVGQEDGSCPPNVSGLGTLGPESGLVLKRGLLWGQLEEDGPGTQREGVPSMRGARGPRRGGWQAEKQLNSTQAVARRVGYYWGGYSFTKKVILF